MLARHVLARSALIVKYLFDPSLFLPLRACGVPTGHELPQRLRPAHAASQGGLAVALLQ
jgi:hypothetical protein